jgi:hypothetical protein
MTRDRSTSEQPFPRTGGCMGLRARSQTTFGKTWGKAGWKREVPAEGGQERAERQCEARERGRRRRRRGWGWGRHALPGSEAFDDTDDHCGEDNQPENSSGGAFKHHGPFRLDPARQQIEPSLDHHTSVTTHALLHPPSHHTHTDTHTHLHPLHQSHTWMMTHHSISVLATSSVLLESKSRSKSVLRVSLHPMATFLRFVLYTPFKV